MNPNPPASAMFWSFHSFCNHVMHDLFYCCKTNASKQCLPLTGISELTSSNCVLLVLNCQDIEPSLMSSIVPTGSLWQLSLCLSVDFCHMFGTAASLENWGTWTWGTLIQQIGQLVYVQNWCLPVFNRTFVFIWVKDGELCHFVIIDLRYYC